MKNKYERLFERERSRIIYRQFILPYFSPDNLVLDIGAGTGFYSDLAKPRARKIFCLDSSLQYITILKRKGYEAILADVNQGIPFPDNTFDIVIALEIIEHLDAPEKFIFEISRVLKKGGYILISTPNRLSIERLHGKIIEFFTGEKWDAWDISHRYIFSTREFKQLVSTRFKILKTVGYYFIHKSRFIPSFLSFLSFSNIFLTDCCFIINIFGKSKKT